MQIRCAEMLGRRVCLVWAIVFFATLCICSGAVSALELENVYVEPNPGLINSSGDEAVFTVYADCIMNGTDAANVTADISGPASASLVLVQSGVNSSTYTAEYSAHTFGEHYANVVCESGNETDSAQVSFTVNMLELEIVSISETEAYSGSISVVRVKLLLDNVSLVSGSDFRIYMHGSKGSWSSDTLNKAYSEDYIDITWTVPVIEDGAYDLSVYAYVDNSSVFSTKKSFLTVRPQVELNILEPQIDRIYTLSAPETFHVVARAKTNPFLVGRLDQSEFCAELDGKKLQIKNFSYDTATNTYGFFVDIYRTDSDDYYYELVICAKPEGIDKEKSSDYVSIQFLLPFEGVLKDSMNKAVTDAKFTFVKNSGGATYDECITDSSGFCSVLLYPGDYDVDMDFGDVSVNVIDADIWDYDSSVDRLEDVIIYDSPIVTSVDGLGEVIKLAAVDFLLPYDSAEVLLSGIEQDSDVSLFACPDWNFERASCDGGWDALDSFSRYYDNIKFTTQNICAYAVVRTGALNIDILGNKSDYFLGEQIILTGTVHDTAENPVSGVSVSYVLEDISGAAVTDSNGFFNINGEVPLLPGDFELVILASKNSYVSAESDLFLKVYRKDALELDVPISLTAELDIVSSVSITLRNSGQSVLYNIQPSVAGMPEEWYDVMPDVLEVLEPGDSADVELKVTVAGQDCDEEACEGSYVLTFMAVSDSGAYIAENFMLYIGGIVSSGQDVVDNDASGSDGDSLVSFGSEDIGDAITGFAVSVKSYGSALFYLLFVVVIVIAGRKMLKKPLRHDVVNESYLSLIRSEILKECDGSVKDKTVKSSASDKTVKENMDKTISNPFG